MLIRFRVKNFRSLREPQELSLVASSLKDLPDAVFRSEGVTEGLLRVAAIYGANASGKTNVLKALSLMRLVVIASQRDWQPEGDIPRNPFLLDSESHRRPSLFDLDFLHKDVRYQYGFELDSKSILEEWLYAYPSGRRQLWFKREGKSFTFGKNLQGENKTIESLTRNNSLFLSAAAQNNHPNLLPIYNWFSDSAVFVFPYGVISEQLINDVCANESVRNAVWQFLSAADLGLTGFNVETELADDNYKTIFATLKGLMPKNVKLPPTPEKISRLVLRHKGAVEPEVPLRQEDESAGTLAYFKLLGPAVIAIASGSTFFVDELDASLHPILAREIVRLFNESKSNPNGAQLIFTTHDTNLLDKSLLRRDQIWFTEKDTTGGTHLYPLSDFKPRKNENLEHGYLQGRYGAVPFIGSTDITAHFKTDDA